MKVLLDSKYVLLPPFSTCKIRCPCLSSLCIVKVKTAKDIKVYRLRGYDSISVMKMSFGIKALQTSKNFSSCKLSPLSSGWLRNVSKSISVLTFISRMH